MTSPLTVSSVAIWTTLATILFFIINFIGRRSARYGYQSLDFAEERIDGYAFNLVFKTAAPTVFIIIASYIFYELGRDDLVLQIYWVAPIYFGIRIIYIVVWNVGGLVNWTAISVRAALGSALAYWAYIALILPKAPIMPDVSTIANELWLLMILFIYSIFNSMEYVNRGQIRRKNEYIKANYRRMKDRFGDIIEHVNVSKEVRFATYGILLMENFNRPPVLRMAERIMSPFREVTSGVMQVRSPVSLSDEASVRQGVERLQEADSSMNADLTGRERIRALLVAHNKDDDYAIDVLDILEILAKRVNEEFRPLIDYAPRGDSGAC